MIGAYTPRVYGIAKSRSAVTPLDSHERTANGFAQRLMSNERRNQAELIKLTRNSSNSWSEYRADSLKEKFPKCMPIVCTVFYGRMRSTPMRIYTLRGSI